MAPAQGQSPFSGLITLLIMVAIFYFLLIAPVRRRQKHHDAMLEALKHGDKVVTSGGIYGTIVGIDGDRLRVKIADQVKIEVARSGIAGLAESDES